MKSKALSLVSSVKQHLAAAAVILCIASAFATDKFTTRCAIHGLSGNWLGPTGHGPCNGSLDYVFTYAGSGVTSNYPGCCGIAMGFATPEITNEVSGGSAAYVALDLLVNGEICSASDPIVWDVPTCYDCNTIAQFDFNWSQSQGRPRSVSWVVYFERNTNSIELADWALKDSRGQPISGEPVAGTYHLPADGISTAQAVVLRPFAEVGDVTWTLVGEDLGCKLTPQGLLTAGTNQGIIHIEGATTINTNVCLNKDYYFDLTDPCECKLDCTLVTQNHSVDVRINMGRSLRRYTRPYITLKCGIPTPDLGNPSLLRCDYPLPDVEKLTNASTGWLRQVRALERVADIVTNSPSAYVINLYDITAISNIKSNGFYQFNGSALQSVTIELVSGDTNQVRVSDSLDGAVTDYVWATNGWTMVKGGGLRSETKVTTVSGGLRREVTTIRDGAGTIQKENAETWQTNSFGERLIEEVFGSGSAARTNTYTYDASGRLYQVTRGDGSWDIFVYDSLDRQIEHYSPFLNSAPTTNSSLCRLTTSTYTNDVVSGSGDDGNLSPYTPRRQIDYVKGVEISRRYTVVKASEQREIRCPNPGSTWNDAANLVTINYKRSDSRYYGRPSKIVNADGTIQIFLYTKGLLPGTGAPLYDKVTLLSGAANSNSTDIVRGTQMESWTDVLGRTLQVQVTDIPSHLLLSSEIYSYDAKGRLTNTLCLDGTKESQTYDCCGARSKTDPDGGVISYTYDPLKRVLTTTRDGITISNLYNAPGQLLAKYRFGTNGSSIRLNASTYDTAGRLTTSTNALNGFTTYSEAVDGSGQTIRTVTYPDASTRIETYGRDRALLRVEGTGVLGVRYEFDTASIRGFNRLYVKEMKLLTNGTDSAEWVRTVNDGVGRAILREFPDYATNAITYNSLGQKVKEVDPDGVVTLTSYDNLGQPEYQATDMDRNDSIDLGGTDRVTRTLRDVANDPMYGTTVRRALTYGWTKANDASATLIAAHAESTDGNQNWDTLGGLTTVTTTDFLGNGVRRITQAAPDGSTRVQELENGRMISLAVSNIDVGVIQQINMGYDAHHRQISSTDFRTGVTSLTYDDMDRVLTITTPVPVTGESAETTTFVYDAFGRVISTQMPDGLWTTNDYYPNGLQRRVAGARIYPSDYTYDYAGRLASLTTWQDYAGQSGSAVTTWVYDSLRGFLTNKLDAFDHGPRYSYTKAGRLQSRTWARGVTATYGYDNAGALQNVDYGDSTPDLTYAYDRLGHPIKISGMATNCYDFNGDGMLLSEDVVEASSKYISQNRFGYDSMNRRVSLTNLNMGITHIYTYDGVSRLRTVSTLDANQTLSFGFSYFTNSSTMSAVSYQQNGTTKMSTMKSFDNLNRLRSLVSSNSLGAIVRFEYAYNAANQRIGTTNVDGSYWAYAYDRLGQLTNAGHYWGDGTEMLGQMYTYAFDEVGNRRSQSSGASGSLRTATYGVNALNQFTNRTVPGYVEDAGAAVTNAVVTVNGGSASRQGEYFRRELGIDNTAAAVVQRLTNTAIISTGTSIVCRLAYIPQTPETYSHDLDGNLTQDGLWTYSWDGENRLIRVETRTNAITDSQFWQRIDFVYDAQGRRIRKQLYRRSGSVWAQVYALRFFYDDWNVIGQAEETSGMGWAFLWGPDLSGTLKGAAGVGGLLSIAVRGSSGSGSYFAALNANGDVSAMVNASDATEVARYEYGPFGEPLRKSGPLAELNPYGFSTKSAEEGPGLLYYGYRFLSRGTGRWLGRDWIEEEGGNNLFAFALNDPVNHVDSQGQVAVDLAFKAFIPKSYAHPVVGSPVAGVNWAPEPHPLSEWWFASDDREGGDIGTSRLDTHTVNPIFHDQVGHFESALPTIATDSGFSYRIKPVRLRIVGTRGNAHSYYEWQQTALSRHGRVTVGEYQFGKATPQTSVTVKDYGKASYMYWTVAGGYPLAFWSPKIDYTIMWLFVRCDSERKLTVYVSGQHDGFPAYEAWINGENVYLKKPWFSGPGIISLGVAQSSFGDGLTLSREFPY